MNQTNEQSGAAAAPGVKTWRERIGAGPDFPLHAPNDVERAMEAEIAELRAAAPASDSLVTAFDAELDKMWKARFIVSQALHNVMVGNQSAWIEWKHGAGAEAAMQWIENGLIGPGLIPTGTEAQVWFDANQDDRYDVPPRPAPSRPAGVQLVPKWAGEFYSYQDWVNKAQSRLASPDHRRAICVDAKGRRCAIGADFMLAREEDAFPVRYFWECEPASAPAAPATVTVKLRALIADDAYAATFQSIGQYRSALLRVLGGHAE